MTPLALLLQSRGKPSLIRALISYGANVNPPERSLLPLASTIDTAMVLLQSGADPHRIVDDKGTPAYVKLLFSPTFYLGGINTT